MASFLELVEHLIEEPVAKNAYLADPHAYLVSHGFAGFDPHDIADALRHTADAFPPSLAAHVNPLDGLDHLAHVHLHDIGLQSFDDFHAPWEHADDLHDPLHDTTADHHDLFDVHHAVGADAGDAHGPATHAADLHPHGVDAGYFGLGQADLRHDVDLDAHRPAAELGAHDLAHHGDVSHGEPLHDAPLHDAAAQGDQLHLVGQSVAEHLNQGGDAVDHDPAHTQPLALEHDFGHDPAHADLTHVDLAHSGLFHDDLTRFDLPHSDLTHIDPTHDPLDEHHWADDHPSDHGHVDDSHLADHDAFGHDPGADIHHH